MTDFKDLGIKYHPVVPTQDDYIEPNGSMSLTKFILLYGTYAVVMLTLIYLTCIVPYK